MQMSHNLVAMNAARMNHIVNKSLGKTMEKLSSGYRINRAADDASGLSISEKMRRQIRGLDQAAVNSLDGISMVRVADGAMHEVHDIIQRGNELCVKAANGTFTDKEREYIQLEIDQLLNEIDGISDRTTFNEIQVLKGKDVPVVDIGNNIVVAGQLPAWVTGTLSAGYLVNQYTTPDGINHASAKLDFSALDNNPNINVLIGELNGTGFYTTCCTCNNHYSIKFTTNASAPPQETSGNHYIYNVNISGITGSADLMKRINAVTGGRPRNHYTQFTIDGNEFIIYDNRAITSINPQSGKFGPGVALSKDDIDKLHTPTEINLQIGGEKGEYLTIQLASISCITLKISSVDVRTIAGASAGIDKFKNALEYVNKERSRMGVYQNRLEHTVNNLYNIVENTQAAESAIRDADMAEYMFAYSNYNILKQAGQAILAQANQSKQSMLNLLRE